MLKRSFVNRQEVAVAMLYTPRSAAEAVAEAMNAEALGADGIAIQITAMPAEERNMETFQSLIRSVQLPFMFINYRSDIVYGNDDEKRQEPLLIAAEAGADVVDVMGDLYAPAERELTFDPDAVAKQRKLIDAIHERGSHVLISSHVTREFVTSEDALAMLKAQSSRGADILKLVTTVNTEDEFLESVRTLLLLNRELDKPFIYLASGKFGKMIRYIGPKFGVAVTFGVNGYDSRGGFPVQPTLNSFRNVLDNLHWDMRNMS